MSVKKRFHLSIALSEKSMTKAAKRAKSLGLSVSEYVQSLIEGDMRGSDDPWQQPLPWEVEKQYLLDEIEFYEAEKHNPQKAAHSVEELAKLLEEDIQQVSTRETD